jgi:hypothetical protein
LAVRRIETTYLVLANVEYHLLFAPATNSYFSRLLERKYTLNIFPKAVKNPIYKKNSSRRNEPR